ncbi:helix-turn-helix domain-containing protein [Parapedobacter sp. 2B3]|uniref:helix-turn-helix domain-containing protein n=1 Tax=Parapedobacter sp. 2B3 TaxID=3342381 RepID=UPI0035B65FB4
MVGLQEAIAYPGTRYNERRYRLLKTPFIPHFKHATIPLTQVSSQPFEPLYPMPFVTADCTEYWVGGSCQFIYRWHDGFDVFVATLEARIVDTDGKVAVGLPVESLLNDLHLVYQLAGESRLPGLTLPEQHHTQVYAVPAEGTLRLQAAPTNHRYALCAAVPKGKWVSRNPGNTANPLAKLIGSLQKQQTEHQLLAPTPISNNVRRWIYILLTIPKHVGMSMDNALNQPVANLVDIHLTEFTQQKRADDDRALVDNARSLVVELLTRLNDGNLPTVALIAQGLRKTPQQLRSLHYRLHRQKFQHYIVQARIEEAKNRLRQRISIAAIAFGLGWTDESHFVNQFKKHTGQTPTEFVKNA